MTEYWQRIDDIVKTSREFVLSDEEREMIASEEQKAYEANLDSINSILKNFQTNLENLGFWVELLVSDNGLRFRFSLHGYYGPGGVSSQFHISGPLVLGEISPHGDAIQSFYSNDIDQCQKLGLDYNPDEFSDYISKLVENYLAPENLIVSKEQYERFRTLYAN